MQQSVELLRELILALGAVDKDELRRGALSAIFQVKRDRDVLAWYLSLPLDSACDQQVIDLRNRGRKICMELAPCIDSALRAKTLKTRTVELNESLACLVVRYGELVSALHDLTESVDPSLLGLLNVCIS